MWVLPKLYDFLRFSAVLNEIIRRLKGQCCFENRYKFFFIPQRYIFLFSVLSAENKKGTNSLRTLRLCGDYKLSNYNTIPYLKIRVLSGGDIIQILFFNLCHQGRAVDVEKFGSL